MQNTEHIFHLCWQRFIFLIDTDYLADELMAALPQLCKQLGGVCAWANAELLDK